MQFFKNRTPIKHFLLVVILVYVSYSIKFYHTRGSRIFNQMVEIEKIDLDKNSYKISNHKIIGFRDHYRFFQIENNGAGSLERIVYVISKNMSPSLSIDLCDIFPKLPVWLEDHCACVNRKVFESKVRYWEFCIDQNVLYIGIADKPEK